MYLDPHDYWIYYVNIGSRHQYGISAAESQTFLLAKRPEERGETDVFAGYVFLQCCFIAMLIILSLALFPNVVV